MSLRSEANDRYVHWTLECFGAMTLPALAYRVHERMAPSTARTSIRRLAMRRQVIEAGEGVSPWGKPARLWRVAERKEQGHDGRNEVVQRDLFAAVDEASGHARGAGD